MAFNIPNEIRNRTEITAAEHEQNYKAVEAFLNTDVLSRDGSVGMTGSLLLAADPLVPLAAATKQYVDRAFPVGAIVDYGGDSAPDGWALGVGQLVDKGSNPILWSIFADKFGASTSTQFRLPDLRSVFVVGKGTATWSDVVGEKGGSKDAIAVDHLHAMAHSHGFSTTATGGSHAHFFAARRDTNASGSTGEPMISNASGVGVVKATQSNTSHSHTVSGTTGASSSANTSSAGASGVDKNLPPYIVLNKIIRLG